MSVADSIRPDARADAEPMREEPREQVSAEDSSVSGESEAEHMRRSRGSRMSRKPGFRPGSMRVAPGNR